jgi:hypothetical protein
MHIQRISLASKILLGLGIAGAVLLSGCATVVLTNLTPSSLPENPSEIYTFTLRVVPRSNAVDPASIIPHVILDGQSYDMKKSQLGDGLYDFDYQLPAGHDLMKYYYLVDFTATGNGMVQPNQAYTGVSSVAVVHRYVLSLEGTRGPIGARVSVLGRGFTPQDVIYLDGVPTRTVFESTTSLSFFVPALATGRNYQVTLGGTTSSSPVGTFRVDPINLTVTPPNLTLASGAQQSLSFSVPNPAPAGGLLIDVATDAPESVIMPEVVIPEGQTSVSVSVQGGKPGTGSLVLKGYGADGQITVPITVTGR